MIFKNLIKTKLCITETFSKTLLSLIKKREGKNLESYLRKHFQISLQTETNKHHTAFHADTLNNSKLLEWIVFTCYITEGK